MLVVCRMDIVAVAQTGSGKTCGYLLPAFMRIHSLDPATELRRRGAKPSNPKLALSASKGPLALVLAPTRELAIQIAKECEKFGTASGIRCAAVFGGVPKGPQLRELGQQHHVLVATPGRLNDFTDTKTVDLSSVKYLVLDEADRMLDMGFEPQIRTIISQTSAESRQTAMFTATWPKAVHKLAATFLKAPIIQVNVGSSDELVASKHITQKLYRVEQSDKDRQLLDVIEACEVAHKHGEPKERYFTRFSSSIPSVPIHLASEMKSLNLA